MWLPDVLDRESMQSEGEQEEEERTRREEEEGVEMVWSEAKSMEWVPSERERREEEEETLLTPEEREEQGEEGDAPQGVVEEPEVEEM